MNNPISVFTERFGWFGFVRLFFYPLTTLLTTPIRLIQTLWNCRVLTKNRLCDYSHFNTFAGMDYLVYWTIALNMQRFGRAGYSTYMGLGTHPIRRFFQHSLISLYPYWKASTVVLLLGMFGWLFSHLLWLNNVSASWVCLVIFLAAISTTFYGNAFSLQNYNVLGWLFFPLGLYGLLTNHWILAAAAFLLISFCSFTITFIVCIVSLIYAVMTLNFAPIVVVIPAGLILLTRFYPFLIARDIKTSLSNVIKSLGMRNKGVVYKYSHDLKSTITMVYFLLIYLQFFAVYYFIRGQASAIFLVGLVLFILNASLVMRFMDVQSIYMLMFSLATVETLKVQDPRILLSYWILVSPLPLLIPFPFMDKVLDVVPVLAPFSIKKLKNDLRVFFDSIKPGERVLMAFDDPRGAINRCFDGYVALLELPIYVASENKIHFMPDNWAVFESNYKGAPCFWGRDIDSVLKNTKFWKADYIVVYQDAGTQLARQWESAGFDVVSKFSWADYEKELRGIKPYYNETPDWWLLRKPHH